MTDPLDRFDGTTAVLVQGSPLGDSRELCTSLLADSPAPSVLFVTYTRRVADCVDRVEGIDTRSLGVITVGDAPGTSDDPEVRTETTDAPADLTGLGIAIGEFLTEWEPPVTVCFESLTALLQYVPFETAYEFVHAVTGRVYAADARIHFHVDPEAHDRQALAGLTSLFDASVLLEENRVRVRDNIS